MRSHKNKNTHSERLNKRNRNEEPIEKRLIREGKLIEMRRREQQDKENRNTNVQTTKSRSRSRSKGKLRANSTLTQPMEIVTNHKGMV